MGYKKLIELCEQSWENKYSNRQNMDKNSYWYGAIDYLKMKTVDTYSHNFLATAAALYCCSSSKLHRDPGLLEKMTAHTEFLLRSQFPSGCISNITCNIDSPPDTAFTLHIIALCYQLMVKCDLVELKQVENNLRVFMQRSIPCMVTGGFHTANHRWIMSGAMALMYDIFKDESLKSRIDEMLYEGLDISEDGEWTERSNGVYNEFCDMMLYHVWESLGYTQVLAAIKKNLELMRYMLHPDNSISTEFSMRQDAGTRCFMRDGYYIAYKLVGYDDKNPDFIAMADMILETGSGLDGSYSLLYDQRYHQKMNEEIPGGSIPDRYTLLIGEKCQTAGEDTVDQYYIYRRVPHKYYNVLRHRNGPVSLTLMAGQRNFAFVQFGDARICGIKLSLGWFGVAGILFNNIKKVTENKYAFNLEIEGYYFKPHPKETIDRFNGDFKKPLGTPREKTGKVVISVGVIVNILNDGLDLEFDIDKADHVFSQVAFYFEQKGTLAGNGLKKAEENLYYLKEGVLNYRNGNYGIQVGSGAREHMQVALRGDSHMPNTAGVLFNYLSPVNRKLSVRFFKIENI